MKSIKNAWNHIVLRAIIISGIGILVGFIFYRNNIFIPTMRPFQFTVNSITAALAYAILKSPVPRNLWTTLVVWYVILTGLIVIDFNWWLLILNCAYISGITVSIYAYIYIARKPFARHSILRIIFAGAIVSVANGLILIVLSLFSFKPTIIHFKTVLEWANINMGLGAIIGLAVGIGIEIAEYVNGKLNDYEKNLVREQES